MLKIDRSILNISKAIDKNIMLLSSTDRGLLSQNVLAQMRNLVEYVATKIYFKGKDVDPNSYKLKIEALKGIHGRGDLRFLNRFHEMLQISASHYTFDPDGSERLMLKYYEYLIRIKLYLKNNFNLNILENISNFPLNVDTELLDYYEKIAERVEKPSMYNPVTYKDRYYIQKIKPFFINKKIYYEVTLTVANGNASKFDRVIAFTQHDIFDNYAIRLKMHNDRIHILDRDIFVHIIDEWEVSIRPCEWSNFSEIFGERIEPTTASYEYRELMKYLTITRMSLTELVVSDQSYYDLVKETIIDSVRSVKIFELLDRSRDIIINNEPGANLLRYLLYKMNNRIIKKQKCNEQCRLLSNLYLDYGCIPFDSMPYCSSPKNHNPKIYDLFESIPIYGHEHEFLARHLKNNTEIRGQLFTRKDEINGFENIDNLVKKHNSCLYYKHTERIIEEYQSHLYIKGYAEDSTEIINNLQNLASSGVSQYTSSVDSWMSRESYLIDDKDKKEALRQMFSNSHVALIYGAAGTGKSTLIKHVSNFWAHKNKLFLANTHTAVENMRRKVTAANSTYSTIAKFLSKWNNSTNYDILFIDECSTVSNADMQKILKKAKFELLVLVGDIYQIESISFGNWFNIAQKFVPKTSIFELTHPFRTTNNELLTVWDRVRKLEDTILELLVKNEYVARLDQSIFEHSEEDEIILCLNYDGLYGINNINRFLQHSNPNGSVEWGINT